MDFYVYVYLDTRKRGNFIYSDYQFDYEPFYVGKGKNKRLEEHLWESRLKHDDFKSRKIKSIINDGYKPLFIKVKENLTENDAFDLEINLINLIGRYNLNLGPLTNLTNGGDGISGLIKTETHRKNLSISSFGKKMSDEAKRKVSESLRGKPGRNTGNKHTQETKNKISTTKKGTISWNATPIFQLDLDGNFIKEWRSATNAAQELRLNQGNICEVLNGRRKSCGGFRWIFKNK
jgi:group I intron endonuclease